MSTSTDKTAAGTDKTAAGTDKTAAGGMFRPVSVDRVSQVIIDQIKALLREGRLTNGDRLPSERDLCQQFGVSRVTVREALRVLEASGLLEVRVGARGGAFVSSPSTERLGEGLADLFSLSPLTAADVTEARMIIETGILPLVVERATPEDIKELRLLVDQGQDAVDRGEYSMSLSAAFHVRVSRCAHNPSIEALVQSFHGPILMSLRQAQLVAPLMGSVGVDEHRALVDCIAAGDALGADAVMRPHLDRTASTVKDFAAAQEAKTPGLSPR